ncbi:ROK family protein, partial [Hominenteromicrobium sp.]
MENKKYVIGADIGGTTVKLGLFEEDGTLLEKWEIPTVIEGDGTAVLHDIAAEIQKCREKHNIPADGILGVGAGIPGPVTADGVVHRCVNLGWGVFDVRTALEETVGLPVVVVNDANAAAMGEAWKGGGRGSENVVFITLGTGVG